MPRLLRLVVTWLLAAAVPLQGYAAARMAACGPEHGAGRAMAVLHHDDGAGVPLAGARSSHPHGHATAAVAAAAAARDLHDGDDATPGSTTCSACAACCAATAPSPASAGLRPVLATAFVAPLVSAGVPAFLTEGLERPPRSLRA